MSEWTSRAFATFYVGINAIRQKKMLAWKCKNARATSRHEKKKTPFLLTASFVFIVRICSRLPRAKLVSSARETLQTRPRSGHSTNTRIMRFNAEERNEVTACLSLTALQCSNVPMKSAWPTINQDNLVRHMISFGHNFPCILVGLQSPFFIVFVHEHIPLSVAPWKRGLGFAFFFLSFFAICSETCDFHAPPHEKHFRIKFNDLKLLAYSIKLKYDT